MIVVEPIVVADSILVSSSVAEDDYSLWVASTSYGVGSRVIRPNHKIYENLISGVNATNPELTISDAAPRWLDCGYVNRWKMFDSSSTTATKADGSMSWVLLKPNAITTALTFQRLVGHSLTITMSFMGQTVYNKSFNLDGTIIPPGSFWQWFYTPYEQLDAVVVIDLPPYSGATITVTLSGAGTVECGVCQLGAPYYVGRVQKKSGWEFEDYSTIEVDKTFGTPINFIPRESADVLYLNVMIERINIVKFHRLMRRLTSKLCVWIPSMVDEFWFLNTYGYKETMKFVIDNKDAATYSLTIRSFV
jgi:hypothetical protein